MATSVPDKPLIEMTLTLLPVPPPWSPSLSSVSLMSCISSQPVSPSETLMPESGFFRENTLLTTSFVACSPQGRQIMASPTQTLPRIYQPLPASANHLFWNSDHSHYSN